MGSYTSYTYVTIGDEVLNSANYTLNCATGEITIPENMSRAISASRPFPASTRIP